MYNLSSGGSYDWSYPTQYDNMVAYRHSNHSANFLFQDAHVSRIAYVAQAPEPLNTSAVCLWYPGEPVNVGPEDEFQGNWYPDVPPIDPQNLGRSPIPWEVIPRYYTDNLLWTQIYHK